MGMFDDITCKYPLPVEGANALSFQTKDTPSQFMDNYEIRDDGTLWEERYDHLDKSEAAAWERAHPGAEAPADLDRFCGSMGRTNKRWEPLAFTGEIVFYTTLKPEGWIEFSSYFVDGKLKELHLTEHRP